MCGIYGYIGKNDPLKKAIEGLKRLEYRGYDSAGIATLYNGQLVSIKEIGKVDVLEDEVSHLPQDVDLVIAHTRWATHGKPSQINAHPHFDSDRNLALVHNGIIENHERLRNELMGKGIVFASDTDTEVVAQLIGYYYEGDLIKAFKKALARLEGAYALALIHRRHPGQILAVAKNMPLIIGIGDEEVFLSSDTQSFASHTKKVIYLSNGELALLHQDKIEVYNADFVPLQKETETIEHETEESDKGHFAHYTLKEIHEQPQSLRNALANRCIKDFGTASFEESGIKPDDFASVERILIVACGTSYHAGLVAQYMIEDMARIPVSVEIASELRYKNPIVQSGTLAIAISQSGETADTLAAVRELKAKGAQMIALCNVQGSTLAREAHNTIFLYAGPEIGVCSTKAYTNQLGILALLSLLLARQRHMEKAEGQEFLNNLLQLPDTIQHVLTLTPNIEALAKRYHHHKNFFFIGRRYMFPAGLEAALKLKEISYINANGYAAGELKHGPIALITPDCPVVALGCNAQTADKLLSNIMEVKARGGKVIFIGENAVGGLAEIADEVLMMPNVMDSLAAIPVGVATQLLAYYIAKECGANIDQPRNLAKSVTVE